ncbi:MAG: ATP-binding protein [Candidatus Marsarchaeota archaeon]|nr:ATP-binding protein [Candidatus Marsarchaeota archaeon]
MKYIKRLLLDEIKKLIERKEIIAIRGPRQSGKTTLLKMLIEWIKAEKHVNEDHIVFVTFEDRDELDSFSQNPKDFILQYIKDNSKHYILIDEAQYCPEVGQKLKFIYDIFENIKLIITGSSSLELKNNTAEFLVGRIFEFELMPLNFYEYLNYYDEGLANMFKLWNDKIISLIFENNDFNIKIEKEIFVGRLLKHLNNFMLFGGYPGVVTAKSNEEKLIVLKNLVNTYIDKDIISFLHISDTIKFRKLVTAIAAADGSMLNLEQLSNEIGTYFKELNKLMDILEQTYIIRRIKPFHKNLVTELKKAQKIYFVDTGLRNYLIENFSDLEKRPDIGALSENFVCNELSMYATNIHLHFWRTTAKTEVDFVASKKNIIPIEVKFQNFPNYKINMSFYSFLNQYMPNNSIIINKNFWGEKIYKKSKIKFVPIVYI